MKSITPVVVATCVLTMPVATQGMKSKPEDQGATIAQNAPVYRAHQAQAIPMLLRPTPISSFELLDAPYYAELPITPSAEARWTSLNHAEVLVF